MLSTPRNKLIATAAGATIGAALLAKILYDKYSAMKMDEKKKKQEQA